VTPTTAFLRLETDYGHKEVMVMPADLLSKPQPHAAPPLAYAESLTLILDPPPAKTPGSSESTCAAFIPQKIAMLKESAPEPDLGGIGEGVIGGVPGGQLGGVIGGVVSGSHTNVPPPTALGAPKKPLRVGGRVKPPRIIQRVAPLYPPLAKQTHIQGVVQIDAVIDAQGNVVEMQAVSGHILLIPAALNAVSQWKFEPTYLNDQPIPIQFVVTVTFQLSQ
jgi:protein TonB